jgi:hypothetical protein
MIMNIRTFCDGQTVCLIADYQDEARNFKPGDTGEVNGCDDILIRVKMRPSGYEIRVRPTLLAQISKN